MPMTELRWTQVMGQILFKCDDSVCCRHIAVDVHDGVIEELEFDGGCNGNLNAIRSLVKGAHVGQVIPRLEHITCRGRRTSCGRELSKALRKAVEIEGVIL